ncbi:MAG: SDR family NAD(P)-dependent oxidoreductase [Actinomycetota bacterium]
MAVVTGGANGIGRACVNPFVAQDMSVVMADRDGATGATTLDVLPAGSTALFVATGVADASPVASIVHAGVATLGGLDIAVNIAGVEAAGCAVADMIDEVWHRVIDVNLTGSWQCMRAELPALLARGGAQPRADTAGPTGSARPSSGCAPGLLVRRRGSRARRRWLVGRVTTARRTQHQLSHRSQENRP